MVYKKPPKKSCKGVDGWRGWRQGDGDGDGGVALPPPTPISLLLSLSLTFCHLHLRCVTPGNAVRTKMKNESGANRGAESGASRR